MLKQQFYLLALFKSGYMENHRFHALESISSTCHLKVVENEQHLNQTFTKMQNSEPSKFFAKGLLKH